MEEKDIVKAPIDILFFTWLHNLMAEGHAEFSHENNNIIELNSFASAWFSVGRDNSNLNGFLGIPKEFIPWFNEVKFKSSTVDFKRGRLYLSCGDENVEGITIGIKVRDKRLKLLWNDNFEKDSSRTLDFRIFAIKADNSITLSEQAINTLPLINTDDISRVVMMSITQEEKESVYAEDVQNKYEKEYASKYFGIEDDDDDDDLIGI